MSINLPSFNPTIVELRCIILFGMAWLACAFVHYRVWCMTKNLEKRTEEPVKDVGYYILIFWSIRFFMFLGGFGFLAGFVYNLIGAFWAGDGP